MTTMRRLSFHSRAGVVLCVLALLGILPPAGQTQTRLPMETISIRVSEGITLSFDISPDGRWIAMDVLGQNGAWSPDGHIIAFTRIAPPDSPSSHWRSAIMLRDVGSGATRELSVSGVPNPFVSNPSWANDGKEPGCDSIIQSPGGISQGTFAHAKSAALKTLELDKNLLDARLGRWALSLNRVPRSV